MSNPLFMFIAGDPSGDHNSAAIIRKLRAEIPGARCYGIGGPKMQAEGFEPLLPFEGFNRMGYWEVLKNLPFFLRAKKLISKKLRDDRPRILVCVDFSGFNTQIMKAAHAMNIPVLWYIAPKIWAWKKKKHTTNLKRYATHVALIFPFEQEIFLPYIKEVSFVGNPLAEYIDAGGYAVSESKAADLRKKEVIRLAIVPGSRHQEVETMLPVMLAAYRLLKQRYPNIQASVSRCGYIRDEEYQRFVKDTEVALFDGPLEDLFLSSDLALVTSGTATLQTALMGVPMVIAYKTSPITYFICRTFIKELRHIGLPNIIARDDVVPECIQDDMTPQRLAGLLEQYIESADKYTVTVKKLISLKQELGSKRPSIEVTNLIKRISRTG